MTPATADAHAAHRSVIFVPDRWARPLAWLPVLSAYVAAAPPERDGALYLDGRLADVAPLTLRAIVERACTYLAGGRDFAPVVLLEGAVDDPDDCMRIADPAELVGHLDLMLAPFSEDPRQIIGHARWVKALVDLVQAEVDRALFDTAPREAIEGLPLVTVRIPTYGSTDLLVERAIPSVLAGAYQNVEVLVCSDGPQPHARAAVEAIDDVRVRYIELDQRPAYPSWPEAFWQTAGIFALNRLLDEARGAFIAPLDHDDAFTFNHIALLLGALSQGGGDFVFGQAMTEHPNGAWALLGGPPLDHGLVVHAAVMYSRRLSHMRYDPHSWLLDEPGDWNMWRRMRDAGAAVHHVSAPVALHFKEGSSKAGGDGTREAYPEIAAADILQTSARELLSVSSSVCGARGLLSPATSRSHAAAPRRHTLALLDSDFPFQLSGFRWHEARAMLDILPEMGFFSANATGESWASPVHALADFPAVATELGITDVYCVFLNFAVSVLGLHGHRGAVTCGGIPPDPGIAPLLRERGIRVHTTLYPGGGLVSGTQPDLLRSVAARCQTVFSNAAEVLSAVPGAVRIPVPMATDFYSFRPRPRLKQFQVVFAADDRPRKGLDITLAAFARLDDHFHLHIAGPNKRYLQDAPLDRITFHGVLTPEQLRDVYWASDAFVSPVRPEGPDGRPGEVGLVDGFPTSTACEALASGCALVSSNPRGERWNLTPEEHYLETPMQDPAALAEALVTLERDRDLRDALAERGAARIREVMDVRRIARAKLEAMGFGAEVAAADRLDGVAPANEAV